MTLQELRKEFKQGFVVKSKKDFCPYGCGEPDDDNFDIYAIKGETILWHEQMHESYYEDAEERIVAMVNNTDSDTTVVVLHDHDCAGMGCRGRSRNEFRMVFK
jgi:hypothetical protein